MWTVRFSNRFCCWFTVKAEGSEVCIFRNIDAADAYAAELNSLLG